MSARPSPVSELCSALPSLPSRLQQVGRFVAANDYDATTRSMRDLAAEAGADPAAFTRLAKALGYSGWDGLRAALTEVTSYRAGEGVRVSVDIDPLNML